ncbi:dephospho-CoA kinase [Coniophora puteana RWD-64-598 SS2]|uniref:Dephospho-CoA kinase n=1 Tax=Coniophora puteana (strain RWD-64-598) TaxID=741705 RepID=R7SFW3_CONPW|nr:dephospho-CoA kinase [Coniophora puteana RWD-64-598 SS2]EIW73979.1 dephospho-CoA kinase [Coniophora puteana RWD-64-598 SS2]
MLVVGLTGGIATGKSTVSNLFKERGLSVIDADIIAREVVQPGTRGLSQIVSTFGRDILLPDGSLDRKKLGAIIFNDPFKRKQLNAIVHPAVSRAILWSVLKSWIRGNRICIVDVPLLIEGGMYKWMGRVVVVYCSAELQLQRLMKRDRSSREDASSRLHSQLPISDKVAYADIVIDNSGSLADLNTQLSSCLTKLERAAGWSWYISWLFPPYTFFSALSVVAWRAMWRSKRPSMRRRN